MEMSPFAAPLFPRPEVTVGRFAFSVETVDFDRDGHADLVSADCADDTLSILRGLGDGLFEPRRILPVGDCPFTTAWGDFNGDGHLDVATPNFDSSDISVILGGSGPSISIQTRYAVGNTPVSIAAVDLDSDGQLDIVTADNGAATFSYLKGRGDGTFSPRITIPAGARPYAMVASDFNDDGFTDIAVASDLGGVRVYLGDGRGGLTLLSVLTGGSSIYFMLSADLDRNGHEDLVMADSGAPRVIVLAGLGSGLFGPAREVATGDAPWGVTVVDIDRDGNLDIATVEPQLDHRLNLPGKASVLFGRGDLTFERMAVESVEDIPYFITSGDYDGDGVYELVTSALNPQLTLISNTGGRTVRAGPLFGSQTRAHYLTVTDFEGDGLQDLAVVSRSESAFGPSWFVRHRNSGDGSFHSVETVLPQGGENFRTIHSADFDGDGRLDLAINSFWGTDPLVTTLLNRNGAFDVRFTFLLEGGWVEGPVGDFDEDGRPDLLHVERIPPTYQKVGIRVLKGLSDGTFIRLALAEVGENVVTAKAADLNGDGHLDLAVANAGRSYPGSINILLGRGDGTFSPSGDLNTGNGTPWFLDVADLNGDGDLDIAVSNVLYFYGTTPDVSVLFGDGQGGFSPATRISGLNIPTDIIAADFSGDRIVDIAVLDFDRVRIFRGSGGGAFLESESYLLSGLFSGNSQAQRARAADFNNDDRVDLAITSDNGVRILFNSGAFPNQPPIAVAGDDSTLECASLAGAELPLDGRGSSDPDSAPGTADDIVSYEWFLEDSGQGGILLGTAPLIIVTLPLGEHVVSLRVTDGRGMTDVDEIRVTVRDTIAPALSARVEPARLWPPNHRLVDLALDVTASDACSSADVSLISVTSSESDDAPGAGDGQTTGDLEVESAGTANAIRVRAERDGRGMGRIYTLTWSALDGSGNMATASSHVVVPRNMGGVIEPLTIDSVETSSGTVIEWQPVEGAFFYNVIRGLLRDVRLYRDHVDLGTVDCMEAASLDTNTRGHEDTQRPPPGEAFFYLADYDDGWNSSYGAEEVGLPRLPASGDCP